MAAIAVTPNAVMPVEVLEISTGPAGGTFDAGEVIKRDASSGKWFKGHAGSATGRQALALTTAKSPGVEVTGLHRGKVNLGTASLDSYDYEAPIYVGASGALDSAPHANGTVVAGYVSAVWGQPAGSTPDKLLHIDF